ncbi:SLC13 family permease [Gemmatimonadota bacterium]
MTNRVVLALGPLILVTTLILEPAWGLTEPAWHVAGLAVWMATWWLSGVIALEATALLPIVFLPLVGTRTIREVTASYADPIIFLFLGGFLLAVTLERWELHRRFAVATVRKVGTDAPRVVLAFMIASAVASMWISNTATAVMMLPIAMALTGGQGGKGGRAEGRKGGSVDQANPQASAGFPTALMLGIAYACSIGGVATLIGTPPNAILAGAASELLGHEISFAGWMLVGLSISIPMLFCCWVLLITVFRVRGEVPGLQSTLERERSEFGALSGGERFVLSVFAFAALAWILRAPKTMGDLRIPGLSDYVPGLSDPAIAIAAALLLFAVPLRRSRFPTALDWNTARRIPWGILLLFGGGLALAGAFQSSGLSDWVGGRLAAMQGVHFVFIILTTAAVFVFLTELTSNTATAALGMPLMVGVAQGLEVAALPLMTAAALAASMAFMLPVATPPNAIVFGSGAIRSRDMALAGIGLNILSILVITIVVSLLL